MRVVNVTPYFLPKVLGGIEVHVFELCKYLQRKGHETAVYTCNGTPRQIDGIEIHNFPYIHPIPRVRNPFPSLGFLTRLRKERGIIHLHGQEFITSFLGAIVANREKLPCILTIHNTGRAYKSLLPFRLLRRILSKTAFDYTIRSAEAVIAPTSEALDVLLEYRPKKSFLIPYGISSERFDGLKKRSDYVLYVGRFVQFKGIENLIRAAALVLKSIDTKFILAGYGPQIHYLKNLTKRLGISNHIEFPGSIPYEKVPNLMASASVFISPENAGYALLEAAMLGKPIVTADVKWNRFCVAEGPLFMRSGDVKSLADALIKVLTDSKLARELSNKAKRFVDHHRSWDAIINRYEAIYEEVMREHG